MKNWSNLLGGILCLVSAGCSTQDVNPAAPRAHSGYVDFYTESDLGLSWRVKRGSGSGSEMRQVFTAYKPIEGNILRLATPVGTHVFEVWFNNQVTTGPQTVTVQVEDAKVSPVHVNLTPAGSTSVTGKSYEYRSTARATRQVTKVESGEQNVFQISAAAGTPQPYQRKEQMPYFSPAAR